MKSAVKAGILYFVVIFAAAFVLGYIRTRLIAPNWGVWAGLAIELPVILALAWVVCRWLVRKLRVPATTPARLTMGVLALALLLVAEALVAVIGLDQSLAQHLTEYQQPKGMIGLAAQLLFAAMPWLRLKYVFARRVA
jgi:hypothetical protein